MKKQTKKAAINLCKALAVFGAHMATENNISFGMRKTCEALMQSSDAMVSELVQEPDEP